MPYGSILHIPPTNFLLLTAKQEPYKKAYLLTKNIEEFSGKSLEERASFVCGRGGEEDRKGPPLFVVGVERRIGRDLLCLW